MAFGSVERAIADIRAGKLVIVADDESIIRHVLEAFRMGGPQIDYGFVSPPSNVAAPSYSRLMTATDETGKNWSYLAT